MTKPFETQDNLKLATSYCCKKKMAKRSICSSTRITKVFPGKDNAVHN